MSRVRLAVVLMMLSTGMAVLLIGCGGGSDSGSTAGEGETSARAELQAEFDELTEESLDAVQAGHAALGERDTATAHAELETAHEDVEEAARVRRELRALEVEEE